MHALDVLAKKHGCQNELREKLLRIYAAIDGYATKGFVDINVDTSKIDPENNYFMRLLEQKLINNGYEVIVDGTQLHIKWSF